MPTDPTVSQTTTRETLAEALWQAESVRASGRRRLTTWAEEGEDTREKWRFMADAALAVVQVEMEAVEERAYDRGHEAGTYAGMGENG